MGVKVSKEAEACSHFLDIVIDDGNLQACCNVLWTTHTDRSKRCCRLARQFGEYQEDNAFGEGHQ